MRQHMDMTLARIAQSGTRTQVGDSGTQKEVGGLKRVVTRS